ncbi:MAG: Rieske (2Fe-2S) protein [Nitrosomonadales bacterium]|jgi:nitrite reductase/ring-hydroxylating ferredoxin subunit|nr:Rieske (2Fe-2S) protein [Nitrosomonadales bacterium]MBT4571616.1 Rieske (2Fe-2S) protein [Nitrosomonadales bacterium]MBT4759490.1 Rieske (2Fe-2S) protein [Nitrosomonadales bacterium]MBT5572652.1 Rieske (2Fe-2S) protein [Nitrosomonadales bacterium]MBT6014617.1 Rieske (2Fe-2S) protein [Nitrosomonadales bacterium]
MGNSVIISKSQFKESADTVTFDFFLKDEKKQGFLLWYDGKFKAYINQCRHLDVCLDWQPNNFFDEEKKFIICSTHGALYSPNTGECISGPCKGKSLIELDVLERNEDIMILF